MRRRKKLTAKSGWFRQGKKDYYNSSVLFQTPMAKQVKERPAQPAESEQEATVESGEGVPRSGGRGRRKTPVQTTSKAASSSPKTPSSKMKPMRTTSVLFTEFSKEGSLQKSLREVVDRLAPMLGFN